MSERFVSYRDFPLPGTRNKTGRVMNGLGLKEIVDRLCRVELCRSCLAVLNVDNWHPFRRANTQRICDSCYRENSRFYRAKKLGVSVLQYQEHVGEIAKRRADRHCGKCGVELTDSN